MDDADKASSETTPETVLDTRLKAMYAAMERPAGTVLPDLGSLPIAGRSETD